MEKYTFTIHSISEWENDSFDKFRKIGYLNEILNKAKAENQTILNWKQIDPFSLNIDLAINIFMSNISLYRKGPINPVLVSALIQPKKNSSKEGIKIVEIEKERKKLLSIRNEINSFNKLNPTTNDPEDFENIKHKITELWQGLKPETQKCFINDDIAYIIPDKSHSEPRQKLELCFDSISKYKKIMDILVSNKFIASNTYIVTDERKGSKSILVAIIKDLHGKGYYRDNIKPSNEEIQMICKNTFGLKISESTTKKAKPDNFDLSFIPFASTIS